VSVGIAEEYLCLDLFARMSIVRRQGKSALALGKVSIKFISVGPEEAQGMIRPGTWMV